MKKLLLVVLCGLLSSCLLQPIEPENEKFLPLAEQYRRCGIRQARLRVQDGSALAAGKSEAAHEVSSACLRYLRAEDSEITDIAYDTASRIMQGSVGARYYRLLCPQPSQTHFFGCGWQEDNFYHFTPNNYSYINGQ